MTLIVDDGVCPTKWNVGCFIFEIQKVPQTPHPDQNWINFVLCNASLSGKKLFYAQARMKAQVGSRKVVFIARSTIVRKARAAAISGSEHTLN